MSKNKNCIDVSFENYKELENKFLKLQSENVNLKIKASLYDSLKDRFFMFKEKALFVFSFLNFLGINSCVYGSFVRKLFDFSLRFDEIKNNNTGSLENSDINIIYMNNITFDKQQTMSEYFKVMNSILVNKLLFNNSQPSADSVSKLLKFNNFILVDLNYDESILDKNNHVNPKTTLLFRKLITEGSRNDNIEPIVLDIKVNIFCFKLNGSPNHEHFPDFTNNMYSLNMNGIYKNYSVCNNSIQNYNFCEYLSLIANNEIKCIKNLALLQCYAFPEDGVPVSRHLKVKWLRQIYEVISSCYLKILDNGFKLVGENVPILYIENKEECHLTSCSPPYPVIILECTHAISLMGYNGIIEKSISDDTEAIRCPFCRADLKIKLVNKKENQNLEINTSSLSYPLGTMIDTKKKFSTLLINKDAEKQI